MRNIFCQAPVSGLAYPDPSLIPRLRLGWRDSNPVACRRFFLVLFTPFSLPCVSKAASNEAKITQK